MNMSGHDVLVEKLLEAMSRGRGRVFFNEPLFIGNGIDNTLWDTLFKKIAEKISGEFLGYRVDKAFIGGGLELVARYRVSSGERKVRLMVLERASRKYIVGFEYA